MGGVIAERVAVFLGPTLPVADAEALLPATYLAPARMGSVYRAGRDGARVIGIVDGYYERVPAVWHKEILWAMAAGVRVYGASSMGALRAAELDAHGMIGVGEVYRGYRDGTLVDDDEVALFHGPAEGGYAPVSVPMVNIRATLAAAAAAGVLTGAEVDALAAAVKVLHYPDRTWSALLAVAARLGVDGLAGWLPGNEVDRKRADAEELLRRIAADTAAGSPATMDGGRRPFEPTWIWQDLVLGADAGRPGQE